MRPSGSRRMVLSSSCPAMSSLRLDRPRPSPCSVASSPRPGKLERACIMRRIDRLLRSGASARFRRHDHCFVTVALVGTPTDRRRTRIVVALAAVALPGGAAAQEPAEQPAATSARVRGRMAEAVRDWTLEYGGRLFVRDTLSRVPVGNDAIWRLERDLDQARVFATFEREILRLAIEVELAGGDAELKDTYIRLAPAAFLELQVGRFKAPMSMIWLESK